MNGYISKQTLKEIRLEKGFTIDCISDVIGLPASLIKKYEGNPTSVPTSVAMVFVKLYKTTIDNISFM